MTEIPTIRAADLRTKVEPVPAVVLDFYQDSCPPCRVLEPRLQRIAAAFAAVPTYRVDIDQDLDVARRFGVKGLPTLLLVRRGAEAARLDGLIRDEDIRDLFESAAERREEEVPK